MNKKLKDPLYYLEIVQNTLYFLLPMKFFF